MRVKCPDCGGEILQVATMPLPGKGTRRVLLNLDPGQVYGVKVDQQRPELMPGPLTGKVVTTYRPHDCGAAR